MQIRRLNGGGLDNGASCTQCMCASQTALHPLPGQCSGPRRRAAHLRIDADLSCEVALRAGAEDVAEDGARADSRLGKPLAAREQAEDRGRDRHREAK